MTVLDYLYTDAPYYIFSNYDIQTEGVSINAWITFRDDATFFTLHAQEKLHNVCVRFKGNISA